METPTLESNRILLRPLSIKDAETAFANWTNDPDVAKYMNWDLHESLKDTLEWLTLEEANISTDTNYTWGFELKDSGTLFGSGGINYNSDYQLFELGYNIMKKYWSNGFATEAAFTIIDFSTTALNINRLLGRHAKGNPASGRVLKKAGFTYQKDGICTSLGGQRSFESREYLFDESVAKESIRRDFNQ